MMSFRHWLSGFYSQILLLKPAINQPRDRESKPVIHRPELCSMFEEQIIKIVGNMQSKYFIHTDTLTAGTQCKQSSFILCIFALVMPFNVSNTIIFAHWITHSHCRWYRPSHPIFDVHDFTFVFVCFSVCLWFCLNKQVFTCSHPASRCFFLAFEPGGCKNDSVPFWFAKKYLRYIWWEKIPQPGWDICPSVQVYDMTTGNQREQPGAHTCCRYSQEMKKVEHKLHQCCCTFGHITVNGRLTGSFSDLPEHSKSFMRHASFTHSYEPFFLAWIAFYLTFTHIHSWG